MHKQQVIEQRATTIAPPEVVYGLLADGSTWPSWSPIGQFELLEPGERRGDQPEGRNAVRLFTTGRTKTRERVVETTPNQVSSRRPVGADGGRGTARHCGVRAVAPRR